MQRCYISSYMEYVQLLIEIVQDSASCNAILYNLVTAYDFILTRKGALII